MTVHVVFNSNKEILGIFRDENTAEIARDEQVFNTVEEYPLDERSPRDMKTKEEWLEHIKRKLTKTEVEILGI